jgi:hypothetical protein
MREVVGFAAGVTVTAAAGVLLRSEAGRRLARALVDESEPQLAAAAQEWRPLVLEVTRAVRLGAAEIGRAVEALEEHLGRIADDVDAQHRSTSADPAAGPDDPATDHVPPTDPDPAS